MNKIIYCRYSTTKQNDGVSIETQIAQIEQTFSINAYDKDTEIIVDRAISGGTDQRPGYKKMENFIKENKKITVYVYRLDRLHRNIVNLISFINLLLEKDCELKVCDGVHEFLGSPDGNLLFKMQGLLAEHERERCAIRTKNAMDYIAKQGKHVGGRIPFGVSVDPQTRFYYYNDQIHIMKEAFILYFKKCLTMKEVETYIKEKYGIEFKKNYLEYAFRNSIYYGYRKWNGEEIKVIEKPLFTKKEIEKMRKNRIKVRIINDNYYTFHKYKFKNILYIDNQPAYVETHRKKSGKEYKYYRNKEKTFKTTEVKLSEFISYILGTLNLEKLLEEIKIATYNEDFVLAKKLYNQYENNKNTVYKIDLIERIDIDTKKNKIIVIYDGKQYKKNNLNALI